MSWQPGGGEQSRGVILQHFAPSELSPQSGMLFATSNSVSRYRAALENMPQEQSLRCSVLVVTCQVWTDTSRCQDINLPPSLVQPGPTLFSLDSYSAWHSCFQTADLMAWEALSEHSLGCP